LNPIEPRPFHRGWPLSEPARHFELGAILDHPDQDLADFAVRHALGDSHAGWWECDLADERLTWTTGVYEIFGLPLGAAVRRAEILALYCEESRAALEQLRSWSIANAKGFILDTKIRPASGAKERWIRLIGAPVVENGRSVRLHGLKLWL
jgi:PAS domain-containing protein